MKVFNPTGVKIRQQSPDTLPEFSETDDKTILYYNDKYYLHGNTGWVELTTGSTGGSGTTGGSGSTGKAGPIGSPGLVGKTGNTGGGKLRPTTVYAFPTDNYVVYRDTRNVTIHHSSISDFIFVFIYNTWGVLIELGYDDVIKLTDSCLQLNNITGYLHNGRIVVTDIIHEQLFPGALDISEHYSNIWTVDDFDYNSYSQTMEIVFEYYDIFGREISPLNISIDSDNNILTFEFDSTYYGYLIIYDKYTKSSISSTNYCNLTRSWLQQDLESITFYQTKEDHTWTFMHALGTENLKTNVSNYGYNISINRKGDSETFYEVPLYDGCTITDEVLGIGLHPENDTTLGATGGPISQHSYKLEIVDENIINIKLLRCYQHVFPIPWAATGKVEIIPLDESTYGSIGEGPYVYGRMTYVHHEYSLSSRWTIHHGMKSTAILVDPRDEDGNKMTDVHLLVNFITCNSIQVCFFKHNDEDISDDEVEDDLAVQDLINTNNVTYVKRTGSVLITRINEWAELEEEDTYKELLYTYYHTDDDMTTWTITHNLNLGSNSLIIESFLSNGIPIVPSSIYYNSNNEIVLYFSSELEGDTSSTIYGYTYLYSVPTNTELLSLDSPYYFQSEEAYYWIIEHEEIENLAVQCYNEIGEIISNYGVYSLSSTITVITFPTKRTDPLIGSAKLIQLTDIENNSILSIDGDENNSSSSITYTSSSSTSLLDTWSSNTFDPEEVYPSLTFGNIPSTSPSKQVVIPLYFSNRYGRPIQIFDDPEPTKPPDGYPKHFYMNLTNKYDIEEFTPELGEKELDDSTGGTGGTGFTPVRMLSVKVLFDSDQLNFISAYLDDSVTGKELFITIYDSGRIILGINDIDNSLLKDGTLLYLKLEVKPTVQDKALYLSQISTSINEDLSLLPIKGNIGLIQVENIRRRSLRNFPSSSKTIVPSLVKSTSTTPYVNLTPSFTSMTNGYDYAIPVTVSNLDTFTPSYIEFQITLDDISAVQYLNIDCSLDNKITTLDKVSSNIYKVTVTSSPESSPYTTIENGEVANILLYINKYNEINTLKIEVSNILLINNFIGMKKGSTSEVLNLEINTYDPDEENIDYSNWVGSTGFVINYPDGSLSDIIVSEESENNFYLSDTEYLRVQTELSTEWKLKHNFNTLSVQVIYVRDLDGNYLEADIYYDDLNTITLIFEEEQIGKALVLVIDDGDYVAPERSNMCSGYYAYTKNTYYYEWKFKYPSGITNPVVTAVFELHPYETSENVTYEVTLDTENNVASLFFYEELDSIRRPVISKGKAYVIDETLSYIPLSTIQYEFPFQQREESDVWIVDHYYNTESISIRCCDENGYPIIPTEIEFLDINRIQLTFYKIVLGEKVSVSYKGLTFIRQIADDHPMEQSQYVKLSHERQMLVDYLIETSYADLYNEMTDDDIDYFKKVIEYYEQYTKCWKSFPSKPPVEYPSFMDWFYHDQKLNNLRYHHKFKKTDVKRTNSGNIIGNLDKADSFRQFLIDREQPGYVGETGWSGWAGGSGGTWYNITDDGSFTGSTGGRADISYLSEIGAGYYDYYWRIRHNLGIKQPRVAFFDNDGLRIHPYRIYFINTQYFEAIFADEFGNPKHVDGHVYVYYNEHELPSSYMSPTSGSGGTGRYGGSGYTGGEGSAKGKSGGTGAYWDYENSAVPAIVQPIILSFVINYDTDNQDEIYNNVENDFEGSIVTEAEQWMQSYLNGEYKDDIVQFHMIRLNFFITYGHYRAFINYTDVITDDVIEMISDHDYTTTISYGGNTYTDYRPTYTYLGNAVRNAGDCNAIFSTFTSYHTYDHTTVYSCAMKSMNGNAVVITPPSSIFMVSAGIDDMVETGVRLFIICFGLDVSYTQQYPSYSEACRVTKGHLYTPKTMSQFLECLEDLEVRLRSKLDNNGIIRTPRTGGSGGSGTTGGTGVLPTSDVFFQPVTTDPMDKFCLAQSKLVIQVDYPDNQNRTMSLQEIYNSILCLPHQFKGGIGDYEPGKGEVNHELDWEYPGDVYRPPFSYHWSQDGSNIKIKFDKDTYNLLWVVPFVKLFDVAFYEEVVYQPLIDTTSYSQWFDDTSDQESYHEEEFDTVIGTPGYDYGDPDNEMWTEAYSDHFNEDFIKIIEDNFVYFQRTGGVGQTSSTITSYKCTEPIGFIMGGIDSALEDYFTEVFDNLYIVDNNVIYITLKNKQKNKSSILTVNNSNLSNIDTAISKLDIIINDYSLSNLVSYEYDSYNPILYSVRQIMTNLGSSNGYLFLLVISTDVTDGLVEEIEENSDVKYYIMLLNITDSDLISNLGSFDNVTFVQINTSDLDEISSSIVSFVSESIFDIMGISIDPAEEFSIDGAYTSHLIGVVTSLYPTDDYEIQDSTHPARQILNYLYYWIRSIEGFDSLGGLAIARHGWGTNEDDTELACALTNEKDTMYDAATYTSSSYYNSSILVSLTLLIKDIENNAVNYTHTKRTIVFPITNDSSASWGAIYNLIEINSDINFHAILYNVTETNTEYPYLEYINELTNGTIYITETIEQFILQFESPINEATINNVMDSTNGYYYTKAGYTGSIPPDGDYDYVGDDSDHRILVYLDTRKDKTTPEELNGDMARHGVIYDGISWSDYGVIIGPTSGFVEEDWQDNYLDHTIHCMPDINVYGEVEDNAISIHFTDGTTGSPIDVWKLIRGQDELVEISISYGYLKYDGLLEIIS